MPNQKNKTKKPKQNWETPPLLYQNLNKRFNFDLDAAADNKNYKCDNYITPEEDSLSQNWKTYRRNNDGKTNKTVWLNCPYGKQKLWLTKAIQESKKVVVVCLIKMCLGTNYFHELIRPVANEVWLFKGRIRFYYKGKQSKGSPDFESIIIVLSPVKTKLRFRFCNLDGEEI